MMAGRNLNIAGASLRASQRRQARGKPPIAAALPAPAVGATVRWRGRLGTVARLPNPLHAMVDFDGKRWLVPLDELQTIVGGRT
jgi:hypothetical protein